MKMSNLLRAAAAAFLLVAPAGAHAEVRTPFNPPASIAPGSDVSGLSVTPSANAQAGTLAYSLGKMGTFSGGKFISRPDGFLSSNNAAGTLPGCASTAGAFATDGTSSWEPSCLGLFSTVGQGIKVYPTRGTGKAGDGSPSYNMFTQHLIQARGDGGVAIEANGQFINMDAVGGDVSAASQGSTNAVGQLISMRQRPGPSGQRPPAGWGHNIDFHIAPNSGNAQSYGVEYDLNNFNKNCAAGSGCLSTYMFFNGINPFPNTSFLYAGSGTTTSFTGTVTTTSSAVTWVSGSTFTPEITRIRIGGVLYRVAYIDPTHLNAREVLPVNASAVAYTTKSDMVHDGILFTGENQVSDTDIHLGTSANEAVRLDGAHFLGINTSADSTKFAFISGAGQSTCFNGLQNCFAYSSGTGSLQYTTAQGNVFSITDAGALSSGSISTAGALSATGVASFAGNISMTGPGANTVYFGQSGLGGPGTAGEKLSLYGGTGARAASDYSLGVQGNDLWVNVPTGAAHTVKVQGTNVASFGAAATISAPLTLTGGITAASLATAGGTVKGTLCVDTTGLIYVKTTTGACL